MDRAPPVIGTSLDLEATRCSFRLPAPPRNHYPNKMMKVPGFLLFRSIAAGQRTAPHSCVLLFPSRRPRDTVARLAMDSGSDGGVVRRGLAGHRTHRCHVLTIWRANPRPTNYSSSSGHFTSDIMTMSVAQTLLVIWVSEIANVTTMIVSGPSPSLGG